MDRGEGLGGRGWGNSMQVGKGREVEVRAKGAKMGEGFKREGKGGLGQGWEEENKGIFLG